MTQLDLACKKKETIVDLFLNQVQLQGDNIAVSFQDTHITYQQLGDKSLALALYLQSQGVAPDQCIGLFVDPSIELMIGVWGILQSGAAYLPLSPEYPEERLKYMLKNSQCGVIVTHENLINRLNCLTESGVVLVSFSQVARFYQRNFSEDNNTLTNSMQTRSAEPHHLAYVIYTSGSTGTPKGVMIEHQSIANQMNWLTTQFSLGSESIILQKTPMSFDAAQWEILAPSCGARVIMGEPGIYKNPEKLISTIYYYGVSVLQGVPTLLMALLNSEKFGQCKTLKHIFSGGEALSKHLAIELSEQFPQSQIINLYGPTECTINSSSHTVSIDEVRQGQDTISIGRAIQNTQYYILDENKIPMPAGKVGELYIGGIGLARGYLHRPELTAKHFIKCRFDGETIDRTLYKTGDLAYWNSNRSVQYAGRVDNQVKLRGYRIELDEIKSIIETHDWVNAAAIFLKENHYTGYQNLIAMIELNPREAALMDQGNQDAHHQSKQSRNQVKMQLANYGCRRSDLDQTKKTIELPGSKATKAQNELVFSRKSYRFFEGGKTSKSDILHLLSKKVARDHYTLLSNLSHTGLGEILRYFGQYLSDERLLPKYGYASPGALYATQMYLEINGIDGIAPGHYYYHPVHHQLILIAPKTDIKSVRLQVHFVGKKSAIEPIYKNNIVEVLEMEAGHMVGLFENILPTYGLSIEASEYKPEVLQTLEVAPNDYYLGSFNITSGKKQKMDDAVALYVQAHADKVTDLDEGKYLYSNGELTFVSREVIQKKHVIAINQAVYERASFGISLLSTGTQDWLSYINLGRKLQSLQMNDINIGLMSSGYSSKTGNDLPSAKRIGHILNKNVGSSYFFIGGRISEKQKHCMGMNEDAVHMKGPSEMIQDDLATYLPAYMMPNKINVIDKMPLTANGKIDINTLQKVELDHTDKDHLDPTSSTEKLILDLWKQGLKQTRISVDADFFELGGNSLIAVSLINQINAKLGCNLPLQVVFSAPTIQKLARAADSQCNESLSRLVPFQAQGDKRPVYCWPGLGGYCMNLRLLAEKISTERSFFGIQAYGINPDEVPFNTITEMAAHDIAMIKKHQGKGPYTLWGYSFGARVAFEACYQLEKAGDIVDNLYLIAPGSPKIRDNGLNEHDNDASFTNKAFVTILYSVFMGTINCHSLDKCLASVNSKESFTSYILGLNKQLDAGLVMRIINIVSMTFNFTYSFSELNQRKLKAPIKIIKATGDDYSFIENHEAFSATKPAIKHIKADHYTMLKTTHIDELVAAL